MEIGRDIVLDIRMTPSQEWGTKGSPSVRSKHLPHMAQIGGFSIRPGHPSGLLLVRDPDCQIHLFAVDGHSSGGNHLRRAPRCEDKMDRIAEEADQLAITARWQIDAPRESVYAIASDFESMPRNFPRLAHSVRLLSRNGDNLKVEAEAASFGWFFPRVTIEIDVTLIPGHGYRASTFNRTFNTTGKEQLLLHDSDGGTEIEYTYIVTVKRKWLRPLYGWLVRTFGLPYWKKCYLAPLTKLAQERGHLSRPTPDPG